MSELGKSLSKMTLTLTVKTGEDGKMFGSVTSGTIADELRHQFDISLDKKKIHLGESIRSTGDYEVELRLHAEVRATLKVKVQSSNPVATPETAAKDAAAEGTDRKTEKRGRRPADAKSEKPA